MGTKGLAAVTHRAVQEEAGLPHGSVTYYFRTRDQLILAAVARLTQLDEDRLTALAHQLAMALAPRDAEPDYGRLEQALVEWVETDPTSHLARYEVLLAGVRDPALRTAASASAATMWRIISPIAVAAGSKDPERDARLLVAMLDGLIFDLLTRDPTAPDTFRAGVERLLSTWHSALMTEAGDARA